MLTNYGDLSITIDTKTGRAKRAGGDGRSESPAKGHTRRSLQAPNAPSPSYDSKLEARYHQYISCLLFTRTIRRAWYHPVTFLLPGGVKYTPDFLLEMPDGALELHECKGSLKMKNVRDSLTRLRLVAGLHPWVTCKVIQRIKGQWVEREVGR